MWQCKFQRGRFRKLVTYLTFGKEPGEMQTPVHVEMLTEWQCNSHVALHVKTVVTSRTRQHGPSGGLLRRNSWGDHTNAPRLGGWTETETCAAWGVVGNPQAATTILSPPCTNITPWIWSCCLFASNVVLWRRASTLFKAPLKRSTSIAFSASSRLK